jgi:hypothetical protein
VLPGLTCAPIDMKIDADGAITSWPTGQVSAEPSGGSGNSARGTGVTHRGLGDKEEIALALAMHPSGVVAVCGAAPTGHPDAWDAAAWIFRPNQLGESRVLRLRAGTRGSRTNSPRWSETARSRATRS